MNETCSRGIQLGALRSAAVCVHLCAHLYTRSIFLVTFAGGGVLLHTAACSTNGEIYGVRRLARHRRVDFFSGQLRNDRCW